MVLYNNVNLNWFVSKFLYSNETVVKREAIEIGYSKSYFRLFYNIEPDFVGMRYLSEKICGCDDIFYRKVFNIYDWGRELVGDHAVNLNYFLYTKYNTKED